MAAKTRDVEAIKQAVKRIRPVNEIGPYAKVLVYGRNGSGKTRFAATAPEVLIIDINEQGTRSARNTKAKVFEAQRWEDIGNMYWYLASGKHPYKSVALDTLTAMQAVAMDFVLDEAEDRDPNREKRMPDKRTYGRAGKLMEGMILAYRNLPMHVVFTAQEREIKDDDTGEVMLHTADLPNSSRGAALGAAGIVGRLFTKEVRVKKQGKVIKKWSDHLLVGPHEAFDTKDRTNELDRVVRNPTMSLILDAWNSDNNQED